MSLRVFLLLFWLVAPVQTAFADTLVLVQGYLGSGAGWRNAGIAASLQRGGWQDAGHLHPAPYGALRLGPPPRGTKRFVTVSLPTEAPVLVQADVLARYIHWLENHFKEDRFVLIGHSAGGVVARAYMVRSRNPKIKGLITIAAPHLGTVLAEKGLAVGNSPLGWFAPFFGAGTINRSRALYADLSRERPGNLVGWLNRQPHPEAKYYAIIRASTPAAPAAGDNISAAFQQDLNQVAALRGRARTIIAPGPHALMPADGPLILNILKEMGL